MTSTESPARRSIAESLAVYLQRRVLIVLLLGFSSGLPLVLTGATLQAWLKVSGIDVKTIGLVTAVAVPYNFKFLWAPLVDALDVPVLGKLLGRRRGWLLVAQVWLMAAILFLGSCDPTVSVLTVVVGAVIVATASATQDIVVDAFRVESLPEDEQAAGMASYVAAYRVGALVSGAGALFLVTAFQSTLGQHAAWTACYAVMAVLILVGVTATLLATEPAGSATAAADHALPEHRSALARAFRSALDSFRDFLSRELAFVVLVFVVLFKLADALAFALLTTFVLDLGFTLTQLATIRNGVGFIAALLGGFAGGLIARAEPVDRGRAADGHDPRLFLAGGDWPEPAAADAHHDHRVLYRRARDRDLRRLPLGALSQSALHGDAICTFDGARCTWAHRFFARFGLSAARRRLGCLFRHLRAYRATRAGLVGVAAEAPSFRRIGAREKVTWLAGICGPDQTAGS
jgi:MFS family permease